MDKYRRLLCLIVLLHTLGMTVTAKRIKKPKRTTTPIPTVPCEAAVLPEPPCCGLSVEAEHMYDEHLASLNELPWLVYVELQLKDIYDRKNEDTTVHCGGSLINAQWVLTAAHCIYHHIVLAVHLGERSCYRGKCGRKAIRIRVVKTIYHRGFMYLDFEEDITLLRLEKPVIFTESIRPICLLQHPVNKTNLIGKKGIVAGWSRTAEGQTSSTNLMKTFVEIWNMSQCKYLFEDLTLKDSYHMCGGTEQNISPCDGDSGGPLMLHSPLEDKKDFKGRRFLYQLGIVSFGVCGHHGSPIVFTNVTNYVEWIYETIRRNS